MTSRRIFSFALIVAALLTAMSAAAKMTDQQVIDYIKRQSAVGKTEQQIGKELLAKGVTPEQIERLRAKYEGEETGSKKKSTKKTTATGKLEGTRESRLRKALEPDENTVTTMTEVFEIMTPDSLALEEDTVAKRKIFGHDLFNNKSLTFEPNENMATPSD